MEEWIRANWYGKTWFLVGHRAQESLDVLLKIVGEKKVQSFIPGDKSSFVIFEKYYQNRKEAKDLVKEISKDDQKTLLFNDFLPPVGGHNKVCFVVGATWICDLIIPDNAIICGRFLSTDIWYKPSIPIKDKDRRFHQIIYNNKIVHRFIKHSFFRDINHGVDDSFTDRIRIVFDDLDDQIEDFMKQIANGKTYTKGMPLEFAGNELLLTTFEDSLPFLPYEDNAPVIYIPSTCVLMFFERFGKTFGFDEKELENAVYSFQDDRINTLQIYACHLYVVFNMRTGLFQGFVPLKFTGKSI